MPETRTKFWFVSADHRQNCLTAVLFQTSAHPWNWNTETVSPCWRIY